MENSRDETLPGNTLCSTESDPVLDQRKQFQNDDYFEFQDGTIYSFQ
jgi:hypothetical protein